MKYQTIKTYGHDIGLSCCFRQWRAKSHCSFLHGYALAIELTFESENLDSRNWVMDFGSLKEVKQFLVELFDHKTLVAEDDPMLRQMTELARSGLIDMKVVSATGCEAFAKLIHNEVSFWMNGKPYLSAVRLAKVVVKEHGANAAAYQV